MKSIPTNPCVHVVEGDERIRELEAALERFIDAWFEGPDYDEPMNAAAIGAMTVMGTTFSLSEGNQS